LELSLVNDAAVHGWPREIERHQCTAQRIEHLLAELGEPLDARILIDSEETPLTCPDRVDTGIRSFPLAGNSIDAANPKLEGSELLPTEQRREIQAHRLSIQRDRRLAAD